MRALSIRQPFAPDDLAGGRRWSTAAHRGTVSVRVHPCPIRGYSFFGSRALARCASDGEQGDRGEHCRGGIGDGDGQQTSGIIREGEVCEAEGMRIAGEGGDRAAKILRSSLSTPASYRLALESKARPSACALAGSVAKRLTVPPEVILLISSVRKSAASRLRAREPQVAPRAPARFAASAAGAGSLRSEARRTAFMARMSQ
jgi:hypothetical protein